MNKQNNIDQLFANKLRDAGTKPSDMAWSRLEANLNNEKKNNAAIWMKIAAAVMIVLVAAISAQSILKSDDTANQFTSVSDELRKAPYPQIMYSNDEDIKAVATMAANHAEELKKTEKKSILMQPAKAHRHLPNNNEMMTTGTLAYQENKEEGETHKTDDLIKATQLKESIAVKDVIRESTVEVTELNAKIIDLSVSDVTLTVAENKEFPKVTITYLGQPEEEKKENNKFSFKKVLNSAKKLANGDLIADLRGAKDELINTAFKSSDD